MASRLDRLVTLLETGSTRLIRETAVNQLSDWQKQHPDELFNLLSRVVPYLAHKDWETRSTAAKAIGKIIEHTPLYDPNEEDGLSTEFSVKVEADLGSTSSHKTNDSDKNTSDVENNNNNNNNNKNDNPTESGIKTETEESILKKEDPDAEPRAVASIPTAPEDPLYSLKDLDLGNVIHFGRELLRGGAFDLALGALDSQTRLQYLKKTLPGRLGFLGRKFSDDEIPVPSFDASSGQGTPSDQTHGKEDSQHGGAAHSDGNGTGAETPGLSSRQLNVLKRKRKREALKAAQGRSGFDLSIRRSTIASDPLTGDDTPGGGEDGTATTTTTTTGKMADYFSLERPSDVDEDTKVVTEFKGTVQPVKAEIETENPLDGEEWPLERLCDFLKMDLFHANWESRHGAAMALREIIRVHGAGAGRRRGPDRVKNDEANARWLDDMACRLCCVLTLDRFTDYSSDTSVAPIRETVGQTLGSVLRYVAPETVHDIYAVLYRMVMQQDLFLDHPLWAVSHGGMVGLRYVVAVRKDLLLGNSGMVDSIAVAVKKGLRDADDDVRSVSAATLIPMAKEFVTMRPQSLDELVYVVWESLSNLGDDLSASTGKIMDLLSTLCTFPQVLEAMEQAAFNDPQRSFTLLVPRLYPFLRHTITSVRLAVVKALATFAQLGHEQSRGWLNGRLLRLVFQNIVVERDQPTLQASLDLWTVLIRVLGERVPPPPPPPPDEPDSTSSNSHENSIHKAPLAQEFSGHARAMVDMALHPIGIPRCPLPMDATWFQKPSGGTYQNPAGYVPMKSRPPSPESADRAPKRRRKSTKGAVDDGLHAGGHTGSNGVGGGGGSSNAHDVDGHMIQGNGDVVGMDVLIRSRVYAARALGLLLATLDPTTAASYDPLILEGLSSPYSASQWSAAMVWDEYARHCAAAAAEAQQAGQTTPLHDLHRLVPVLQNMVEGERPAQYRELVNYVHRTRSQCQQLLNLFRDHGKISQSKLPTLPVIVQGEAEAGPTAFSLALAEKCTGEDFERLTKLMAPGQRLILAQQLDDMRTMTVEATEEARLAKAMRDVRVRAVAACALVAIRALPKKLSVLIKSIMDSVKAEENIELQSRASTTIAQLVQLFTELGRRGPADKVVANLVKFSCMEVAETPEYTVHAAKQDLILSMQKEEDRADHADAAGWLREARAARITRRGAKQALEILARMFGGDLLTAVPSLRDLMERPLREAFAGDWPEAALRDPESVFGQEVVDAMSIVRTTMPTLDASLHGFVMGIFPYVKTALQSRLSVFRYMAAKCIATICSVITVEAMTVLVEEILPAITNPRDLFVRQGVMEAIYHLIAVMGDAILPYVIFLIVPVLGRMSDSDHDVRLMATTSFATLVKLVPLEEGIPDPPGLSQELLHGRDRERTFMAQLLDPKKVEPFTIPVAIKAELRSYQQEGVNWLHFLNKYHLHGILCDDMGLGKTLQTICIVASDHHQRAQEFAKTAAPDVRPLPSLIICPPTLPGHWLQELATYAPFLTAMAYVGPPAERSLLRGRLGQTDIVITSYDVCRNDTQILQEHSWNYVVLDEGHLIKNPKAKITIAVKTLVSHHRLILTGTPIQNNVLELWSLFDFLMPGFLGAEKVFLDRFAKPIAASRNAKASSKEQEAGALAIEALHKQVLPFLLRRLKEEVLNDLPPKILQNYYCDLSDLQRKLLEDFTRKQGKAIQEQAGREEKEAKQHIFQALQYMRKLCNSPALVMKPGHALYDDTQRILAQQNTRLDDPVHAPKLTALRDLLVDCGIGLLEGGGGGGGVGASATGHGGDDALYQPIKPHRALIFCQMKEMLDMVQNTVLKRLLPGVSYLRLDGSVEANKRQDIVNTFNKDPSYDVLLLTTSVGGLGLNLTGADTVIFVEHDWNPQKDLQAMDRAHRIGQKKVVNVYRLITRGTLEEKILNLQRFKMDVASTVVNQQNAGLGTMDTDQILDLFSFGTTDTANSAGLLTDGAKAAADGVEGREEDMVDLETGDVRAPGKKGWLDDLGELWDNKQYEESFDLDGFLQTMQT